MFTYFMSLLNLFWCILEFKMSFHIPIFYFNSWWPFYMTSNIDSELFSWIVTATCCGQRFQFFPTFPTVPPHSSALVGIDFNWILPESWTHSKRWSPGRGHKNSRIQKKKHGFINTSDNSPWLLCLNVWHTFLYDSRSGSSCVLFLPWPPILSFYAVLCASQVHLPQHPSRGNIQ